MTRSGWDGSDDASDDVPDDLPDDVPDEPIGTWPHGDDDDVPDVDSAPISAYERPWRHPSELGPLIRNDNTVNYPGRNLFIASALIGLTFAVVLVRLVTAEGAGHSTSVQTQGSVRSSANALTSVTAPQSTAPPKAPSVTPMAFDRTETAATAATGGIAATTLASRVIISSAVATSVSSTTTRVRAAVATSVQPSPQRMRRSGVAVNGGSELLTTAKGLTDHARIEVVLADGAKNSGEVTTLHAADGFALVTLDSPVTAPKVGKVDANESRYHVAVDGLELPCKLALRNDGMIVKLDRDADEDRILEGSPIIGDEDQVVGLTTWSSGTPYVVELTPIVESLPPTSTSVSAPSNLTVDNPTVDPSPTSSAPESPPSTQQLAGTTAIPAATAAATSAATGGWFGVIGSDSGDGVKVTAVVVGSPAQFAGLVPDSVIVTYEDTTLTGIDQLARLCRATPAGATVDIGFRLPGSTLVTHVEVTLGAETG